MAQPFRYRAYKHLSEWVIAMDKRNFTEEERHAIDSIYKRNKENLTSGEVELLVAWETQNAMMRESYQEEMRLMNEQIQQDMQHAQEEHQTAVTNMNAMHQAAMDRLEAVMALVKAK